MKRATQEEKPCDDRSRGWSDGPAGRGSPVAAGSWDAGGKVPPGVRVRARPAHSLLWDIQLPEPRENECLSFSAPPFAVEAHLRADEGWGPGRRRASHKARGHCVRTAGGLAFWLVKAQGPGRRPSAGGWRQARPGAPDVSGCASRPPGRRSRTPARFMMRKTTGKFDL